MKSKAAKRILSLLLAAVMLCSLSVTAFADGEQAWPRIKEDGGFVFKDSEGEDKWTLEFGVADTQNGSTAIQDVTFTSADITVINNDELVPISEGVTQYKTGTIILNYGDKLLLAPVSQAILNKTDFDVVFEGEGRYNPAASVDLTSGTALNFRMLLDPESNAIRYLYDFKVVGNSLIGHYPEEWTYDAAAKTFTIESDTYIANADQYSLVNKLEPTWGTVMDKDTVDLSGGSAQVKLTNAMGTEETYTINLVMPMQLTLPNRGGYDLATLKVDGDTVAEDVALNTLGTLVNYDINAGKAVALTLEPVEDNAGKVIDTITFKSGKAPETFEVNGNTVTFTMPSGLVEVDTVTFKDAGPAWPRIKEEGGFVFKNSEGEDKWTLEFGVADTQNGAATIQEVTFTSADITVINNEELEPISEGSTQYKTGTIVLNYGDRLLLDPVSQAILNKTDFDVVFEGEGRYNPAASVDLTNGTADNFRMLLDPESNAIRYLYDFKVVGNNLIGHYPETWTYDAAAKTFTIVSDTYIANADQYSLVNKLDPTWGTVMDKDTVDLSGGSAQVKLTNAMGTEETYTIKLEMPMQLTLPNRNGYDLATLMVDGEVVAENVELNTLGTLVHYDINVEKPVALTLEPVEDNAGKVIDTITFKSGKAPETFEVNGNTVTFTMPAGLVEVDTVTFKDAGPAWPRIKEDGGFVFKDSEGEDKWTVEFGVAEAQNGTTAIQDITFTSADITVINNDELVPVSEGSTQYKTGTIVLNYGDRLLLDPVSQAILNKTDFDVDFDGAGRYNPAASVDLTSGTALNFRMLLDPESNAIRYLYDFKVVGNNLIGHYPETWTYDAATKTFTIVSDTYIANADQYSLVNKLDPTWGTVMDKDTVDLSGGSAQVKLINAMGREETYTINLVMPMQLTVPNRSGYDIATLKVDDVVIAENVELNTLGTLVKYDINAGKTVALTLEPVEDNAGKVIDTITFKSGKDPETFEVNGNTVTFTMPAGLVEIDTVTFKTAGPAWPQIKEDGGFVFKDSNGEDKWTVEFGVANTQNGATAIQDVTFTSADITVINNDELIPISEGSTQYKTGTIVLNYGDRLLLDPVSQAILNKTEFDVVFEGSGRYNPATSVDLTSGTALNFRMLLDPESNAIRYLYDFKVVGNSLIGHYPETWTYDAATKTFTIVSDTYIANADQYSLVNKLDPTWGTVMDKDTVDLSGGSAQVKLTNAIGTEETYTINLEMPMQLTVPNRKGYDLATLMVDGEVVAENVELNTLGTLVKYDINADKTVALTLEPVEDNAGKVIDTITFKSGKAPETFEVNGNTVTFTMPAGLVEVDTVTFKDAGPAEHLVTADEASLTLDGTIGVNFKMFLPESMAASDTVQAVFIYKGQEYPIAVKGMSPDEEGRYVFTYRIPAKEFANTIGLKFMDGDEVIPMQYGLTRNAVEDNILYYSAQEYSQSLPESSDARALVTALQNYCAWAYLGLKDKDTVDIAPTFTAGYDVSGVTVENLSGYKAGKTGAVDGLTLKAYSLTLENTTAINLKFTLDEGYRIDDYTFSLDDGENTKTVQAKKSGSYWVVVIPDIKAKKLDTMYTLTVTKGEGEAKETMTVSCSALSYGYSVLKNAKQTTEMQRTVQAMYLYNQQANTYFGD